MQYILMKCFTLVNRVARKAGKSNCLVGGGIMSLRIRLV